MLTNVQNLEFRIRGKILDLCVTACHLPGPDALKQKQGQFLNLVGHSHRPQARESCGWGIFLVSEKWASHFPALREMCGDKGRKNALHMSLGFQKHLESWNFGQIIMLCLRIIQEHTTNHAYWLLLLQYLGSSKRHMVNHACANTSAITAGARQKPLRPIRMEMDTHGTQHN